MNSPLQRTFTGFLICLTLAVALQLFHFIYHYENESLLMHIFLVFPTATALIFMIVFASKYYRNEQELNTRINHLKSALDSAHDMIFFKNTAGEYTDVNKAFASIFEATPEDFYQKDDNQIFSDDEAAFIKDLDQEVINSGRTIRYESWLTKKNGDKLLRETLKAPIYGANQQIQGIVGISRDITDQHRIKIALHQRERLLGALSRATQHILLNDNKFEEAVPEALRMLSEECNASAGIILEESEITPEGTTIYRVRYSWWNNPVNTFSRLALPDRGTLQNLQEKSKSVLCITDTTASSEPVSNNLADLNIRSIIASEIVSQNDYWGILCFLDFNHKRKWSTAEQTATEIAASQFAALLERKQAEESLYKTYEALSKSQSNLKLALEAANAIPFEFDLSNSVFKSESSFFSRLGYEDDWHVKNISDLIFLAHPDDQQEFRRELELIFTGQQETLSIVVRLRKPGDEFAWINFMGIVQQNDLGMNNVVGLIQNITEKKRAETELLHSEKMAAVGTLAAGVAHNFNNLNTGILGHLQMLKRKEDLSESGLRKLELVINTVNRSINLTDSLLAFSGKKRGSRSLQPVYPLIIDTINLLSSEFAADGINFENTLDENVCAVCNPGELCHVMFNILVNARHALSSAHDKIIRINCGSNGKTTFISISDTGCGIPQEKLKEIFLPFYTTKGEHAPSGSPLAKVRGTGLGLSSSKSIITAQGGEITVSSAIDEGTEFIIWLPAEEMPGGVMPAMEETDLIKPITPTQNDTESNGSEEPA